MRDRRNYGCAKWSLEKGRPLVNGSGLEEQRRRRRIMRVMMRARSRNKVENDASPFLRLLAVRVHEQDTAKTIRTCALETALCEVDFWDSDTLDLKFDLEILTNSRIRGLR
jgi:hypothetical protein